MFVLLSRIFDPGFLFFGSSGILAGTLIGNRKYPFQTNFPLADKIDLFKYIFTDIEQPYAEEI